MRYQDNNRSHNRHEPRYDQNRFNRNERRYPNERKFTPTYMSPEWIEEYRVWYDDWKRYCWNKRFDEINSRSSR